MYKIPFGSIERRTRANDEERTTRGIDAVAREFQKRERETQIWVAYLLDAEVRADGRGGGVRLVVLRPPRAALPAGRACSALGARESSLGVGR